MIIRESCPICNSPEKRFLVNMTKEYLITGDQGWKHDPLLMEYAGFNYDNSSNPNCSYYKCLKCSTFYLRELYPIEEAFALYYANDKSKREDHNYITEIPPQ